MLNKRRLMKQSVPKYIYDNLNLVLLRENDLLETLQWRNHYREWFNQSHTLTLADHQAWFHQYQAKDNDFVFIICNELQQKIGQASIYNIDWNAKKGEFGRFLVNPMHAGQRFMKKACLAMLELCQIQFALKYLYLEVKKDNLKAIHIYHSAGFELSPLKKSHDIGIIQPELNAKTESYDLKTNPNLIMSYTTGDRLCS